MASPDMSAITPADEPQAASRCVDISFDNSYARLPERLYARVNPTRVAAPGLVKVNAALALELGLDPEKLASKEGVEVLAGNRIADGSEPIAMSYAGHQFGYFVPQLGDGRAILLGEVIARNGQRYDIQLKGSGRTPFSRGGDGRAALGPVLREYIVSEAMAALGVPTTRTLAAVTTGQRVLREVPLPGAVLTRVASSHIRVGTFQYFAARRDLEATRVLADYAIARHYPEAAQESRRYHALFEGIIGRQARLIAQWMLLGFIHGVMNTDNMAISGETIDYGPCAFMEEYHPGTVFSSIDANGRYAYGNQPTAALWNLARLAEAILPLLAEEVGGEEAALTSAREALSEFDSQFAEARRTGLLRKIGLATERGGDAELVEALLERMATSRADFTLTFRRLCDAAADPAQDEHVRALFADPTAYDRWAEEWRHRLTEESVTEADRAAAMRAVNPAIIPRNHLVEEALIAATNSQDFRPFEELLDVVTRPYENRPDRERFALPARPEERVLQTFCGT
jgi:uncharacterized protein YdiU (UPF0061 family)